MIVVITDNKKIIYIIISYNFVASVKIVACGYAWKYIYNYSISIVIFI